MGLSIRTLLVDRSYRVYQFSIAKFDELRRYPARHRHPQIEGERVRAVEAVVELVDRKQTRVVRMTFKSFLFDRADCFESNAYQRHQFSRAVSRLMADVRELTEECDATANVVDASTHFTTRGGRWVPPNALAPALQDSELNRVKRSRL